MKILKTDKIVLLGIKHVPNGCSHPIVFVLDHRNVNAHRVHDLIMEQRVGCK